MPPMLEVHRVVQRFDGGAAVHGVSPSLEPAPASTASSAPMAPAFSDGQQEPGDFVPVLMTDPDGTRHVVEAGTRRTVFRAAPSRVEDIQPMERMKLEMHRDLSAGH